MVPYGTYSLLSVVDRKNYNTISPFVSFHVLSNERYWFKPQKDDHDLKARRPLVILSPSLTLVLFQVLNKNHLKRSAGQRYV